MSGVQAAGFIEQNQQDGYLRLRLFLFSRSLKPKSINTKICSRSLDAVTPQSRIHCLAPASSEIACLRSVGARRDEDGTRTGSWIEMQEPTHQPMRA